MSGIFTWLVVANPSENISQIGNLPQIRVKKKVIETTSYLPIHVS